MPHKVGEEHSYPSLHEARDDVGLYTIQHGVEKRQNGATSPSLAAMSSSPSGCRWIHELDWTSEDMHMTDGLVEVMDV